ncbi:MAG: HIRAN domain-containing protein [Clostridia bacterium]|nr:HIRAN domain-containing protein [Clostridia bacterium]
MDKKLWLIWKEPIKKRNYIIGILEYKKNRYFFKYVDPELNDARKSGLTNFPGFDVINKVYESVEMFSNIEVRLPNKGRPDYLDILNMYDLDIYSTKMEILKNTNGKLLTDNFSFVPVFNENKIEFEVVGIQYRNGINEVKNELVKNSSIVIERDEKNEYDKYAIRVLFKNNHLGFIPRYYSKQVSELMKKSVRYSAKVKNITKERTINNEERVRLFVRIIFEK